MKSIRVALVLVVAAMSALVFAQAEPGPRVIVMKIDGGSVAGELLEATPAGVSVRSRPTAEPVAVLWRDIKRINNGLTRRAVLAKYRKDKPNALCETCKGDGGTPDPHCQGTGIEPSTAKDCETCKGKKYLGNCPKGVDGDMPCPAPCLKKEAFSGPKDADGKRWKSFKGKSGTLRISDSHVGEIVAMEKGDPVMKGRCTVCEGATRVVCNLCQGTGRKICQTCDAVGKQGPACAQCERGLLACEPCHGTGMKATP